MIGSQPRRPDARPGEAKQGAMRRSEIDTSIERRQADGFDFPLGVYPLEECHPRSGYAVEFEPADGGEAEGEWEEWPDRYMYDIVVPARRLRPLVRALFSLLGLRVYPILDILGHDAYREVDPYIAYEPVGVDHLLGAIRRHGDWLFEDGMVGFGAMTDGPFLYVYVDEHKVVTVRTQADQRDRVERVLAAFDLEEAGDAAGADASAHEHRTVLRAARDDVDLMVEDEIVAELREAWRLEFNVDRFTNQDDDGRELGVTCWRCIVRTEGDNGTAHRFWETLVTAGCLDEAERLALEAVAVPPDDGSMASLLIADRVRPEEFAKILGRPESEPAPKPAIHGLRPLGQERGAPESDAPPPA